MTFKQKIYEHLIQLLQNNIDYYKHELAELREIASNETKSTVGDKYETARAMLQIEQDNTQKKLSDLLVKLDTLKKINPHLQSDRVIHGSIVKTNNGQFFISVAAGKINIDGYTVTTISSLSPLGRLLLTLQTGQSVMVNSLEYTIEKID